MYIMLALKTKNKNNNLYKMAVDQGKYFQNLQNKVIQKRSPVDLARLQTTPLEGVTGVNNLLEGFSNDLIDKEYDENMSTLRNLEDKFNKVLGQYQNTYNLYVNNNQNLHESVEKYVNKAIKSSNKSGYYYVNKYGFKRFFSQEAWEKRPETCPKDVEDDEDSMKAFAYLRNGMPMGLGEQCGSENKNFLLESADAESNKKVYLSKEGKIYDYETTSSEITGCPPSTNMASLSEDTYETLTKGGSLSDAVNCSVVNDEDSYLEQLIEYNEELMSIVDEMNKSIIIMAQKDEKVGSEMREQETILYEKLKQLNNDKHNFEKMKQQITNYNADLKDNILSADHEYSIQLFYTIAALGLGIFTIRYLMS